jgi:hypothetical protein
MSRSQRDDVSTSAFGNGEECMKKWLWINIEIVVLDANGSRRLSNARAHQIR